MDRVTFAQPPFHLFSLRGQHDPLPGNGAGAFAIFGHYVRTFVEDLDDSIRVGSFEVVRGKGCMMVLHLVLG